MKSNVIGAAIITIGLVVSVLIAYGRYSIVKIDEQAVARLDRWTGAVSVCELPSAGPASCEYKEWEYVNPAEANEVVAVDSNSTGRDEP